MSQRAPLLALAILVVGCASKAVPEAFKQPRSEAVDNVNSLIGNGGYTPNSSGGMIPSTAPPFAMTRWVAQTRENYVSVTPYNVTDTVIHGFQSTHQPAIWMGETGPVSVVPGSGRIQDSFEKRGMQFLRSDEIITPSYYSVPLTALEGGTIFAEQSATSRVGHLRFTYTATNSTPYILIVASRPSTITSDDPARAAIIYPEGTVSIDAERQEITGSNQERQDSIIAPTSTPATGFKTYFCARFDTAFEAYGISQNGTFYDDDTTGKGSILGGYAKFAASASRTVNVRIGVSFISVDQARRNLDTEIPDGTSLEKTAALTRTAWAEKLDRIKLEGATAKDKQIFYTAFFHTLQYPYEQSEDGQYYSGYDDKIHQGISYTGYSIWDTFRAEWAWLILFAPERVPGMITSMLQDYQEGGWLPMWKNIIETNIMVGTHADSLIAEAVVKGITGFDLQLAWDAVYKDATVPPVNDHNTSYSDREEGVDYEVRAGLSSVYAENGWVAADVHSESASRTLDYAYDDYAVSVLAQFIDNSAANTNISSFRTRGLKNPFTLFNNETGFMQARYANGSWAGEADGWTEGDKWAYSFDVVQDIPGLIEARGGKVAFVESLDAHFDGGHNDHTNEPSHHIPYLYALAGAPSKTQEHVREIARLDYDATPEGLSGNEDCGQMSAWYLFSALGFYNVDPVSGDYVIGSPFFDKVTIDLPGSSTPLVISSPEAATKIYVKSFSFNGEDASSPLISHGKIAQGGSIVFEMSEKPESLWAATEEEQKIPLATDHTEL